MKTFRKISAVLLVMGIVVATFFACNKEKEQTNSQPQEAKIPIASIDLRTGVVTYPVTNEEYQEIFNNICSKGDEDFIFEYIEIIDENAKNTNSGLAFECSVIDARNECSFVTWLNNEFFDIVDDGTTKTYFLKDEVSNGDFSFISYCSSGAYLITVQGNNYQAELFDINSKSDRPKRWQVSCSRADCTTASCTAHNYGEDGWGCSACVPAGDHPSCVTNIAPNDTWWRILQALFGVGRYFL